MKIGTEIPQTLLRKVIEGLEKAGSIKSYKSVNVGRVDLHTSLKWDELTTGAHYLALHPELAGTARRSGRRDLV